MIAQNKNTLTLKIFQGQITVFLIFLSVRNSDMATNWPVVRLVRPLKELFLKFNPFTIKYSRFCAKHNIFLLELHTSGNRSIYKIPYTLSKKGLETT